MSRVDQAIRLRESGYNCCQALLCSYADILEISQDDLKTLGSAYGIGMKPGEGICGALCAAEILITLKKNDGSLIRKDIEKLREYFEDRAGAVICKNITGKKNENALCDCSDCFITATKIVEDMIRPNKVSEWEKSEYECKKQ